MPNYQPFIYIIGWTELNAWYLGAKWAKGCQPLDLWTTYFTSSDTVAELREDYGEPDYFETFPMDDVDALRELESQTIKEFELHKGSRWLNRGSFKTYNPTSEERSVWRKQEWAAPDIRERRIDGIKIALSDPEYREGASQRTAASWDDPTIVAKRKAGYQRAYSDPVILANKRRAAKESSAKPETTLARIEGQRLRYADPAARERASEANRQKWADPEIRASMLAKRKAKADAKKAALSSGLGSGKSD